MNKLLAALFLFCCVGFNSIQAVANFDKIYPSVLQVIEATSIFHGDRHGQFEGDYVANLTDGSAWKIHPDSRETYANWNVGELVRVRVRQDWYWFKREHKFELYNYDRGETVKVMLVHHKNFPASLKIVTSETYHKSYKWVTVPSQNLVIRNGKLENETHFRSEKRPAEPRKILGLSDGSYWVIKENLNDFMIGQEVYIGAQGHPTRHFDFILITGNEREAKWTYGRPQK